MKVVMLVTTLDPDDSFSVESKNTKDLAKLCNHLIYWFIIDNPSNQAIFSTQLSYFIKTIDENIDSHRVISAIYRNNIR